MLNFHEFSEALLDTQDLDPVYVAMVGAGLSVTELSRLCLTYWCFYHLGASAYIADSKSDLWYWQRMRAAAENKGPGLRWPRASERRHFRGQQAIDAVESLHHRVAQNGGVGSFVAHLTAPGTFQEVVDRVQLSRGFGPWISFKIADMSERVFGSAVDFTDCELGFYKDPRQGAALVRFGDYKETITNMEFRETVNAEVRWAQKKKLKAPPKLDRLVNVQEIETCMCKYKSYVKGHYWVGKDITEVQEGLHNFPLKSRITEKLVKALPRPIRKGQYV